MTMLIPDLDPDPCHPGIIGFPGIYDLSNLALHFEIKTLPGHSSLIPPSGFYQQGHSYYETEAKVNKIKAHQS